MFPCHVRNMKSSAYPVVVALGRGEKLALKHAGSFDGVGPPLVQGHRVHVVLTHGSKNSTVGGEAQAYHSFLNKLQTRKPSLLEIFEPITSAEHKVRRRLHREILSAGFRKALVRDVFLSTS